MHGMFGQSSRRRLIPIVPILSLSPLNRRDPASRNKPGFRNPRRQRGNKPHDGADAGGLKTGLPVLVQHNKAAFARGRKDLPQVALRDLWRGHADPFGAIVANSQHGIVAAPRRYGQPSRHHSHVLRTELPWTPGLRVAVGHCARFLRLRTIGSLLVHNVPAVSTLFRDNTLRRLPSPGMPRSSDFQHCICISRTDRVCFTLS